MLFKHCYSWIGSHDHTSLSKDMITLSKRFDTWYGRDDVSIVCIDYSKFDAHMSSIDVYDIKRRLARKSSFTKMHLDLERLDYPLYDPNNKSHIVERATKLCSGDYLTSFMGTFFQLCTYDMYKNTFNFVDYMCGGDDAAMLLGRPDINKIRSVFANNVDIIRVCNEIQSKQCSVSSGTLQLVSLIFKSISGDDIAIGKSNIDIVAYNRRIWNYKMYPYNNLFTMINAIYRKEKQSIDVTVDTMRDRFYDIYCTYVALLVRMKDFDGCEYAINKLAADIESITGNRMNNVYFKNVSAVRKKVQYVPYPSIESVKEILEFTSNSTFFNTLYHDTVANTISRYISSPFIDTYNAKYVPAYDNYAVDVRKYYIFTAYGYNDIPY